MPKYKVVDNVTIDNGDKAFTRIYHKNGFSVVCKRGEEDKYLVKYEYPTNIKAPLLKGQKIGEVKYYIDDNLISSVDILSDRAVDKNTFIYMSGYIIKKWFSFLR